jgi:hypothetical protein
MEAWRGFCLVDGKWVSGYMGTMRQGITTRDNMMVFENRLGLTQELSLPLRHQDDCVLIGAGLDRRMTLASPAPSCQTRMALKPKLHPCR